MEQASSGLVLHLGRLCVDSAACAWASGPAVVSGQDLTEDEEAEIPEEDVVEDAAAEDEDDEAEVEDDENAELVSRRTSRNHF